MKKQIAKNMIVTSTYKKKKWYKIIVNGKKTLYDINKKGEVRNRETGLNINPSEATGYLKYVLYVNGKRICISIHRLLGCVFIPIPKSLIKNGYNQLSLVINHKDGNKKNNVLSNLEWTTPKGNMEHALRTGLCDGYIGQNSRLSKITEKQAIEICELLSSGIKPREVANITGIDLRIIRHIFSHETWKKISSQYDFKKDTKSIPYKLNDEVIKSICELLETGKYTYAEIAKRFNISMGYVGDIKNRRRRKDISSNYNFNLKAQRLSNT